MEHEKLNKNYEVLPNSAATNAIKMLLSGNEEGNIRSLKNTKIDKTEFFTENQYCFISRNSNITISVDKLNDLFNKQDKKTKKIFNFLLQQYNKQNKSNEIVFHLRDIIGIGIYKNIDSARNGVKSCLSKLMSIRVSGTIKKGKNDIMSTTQVVFIGLEIKKGVCTVNINPKFNMALLVQYFTILPLWTYSLNSCAYDVADYIFYRARQNTDSIKNHNSFAIKIDSISRNLNHPDPNDTERHKQLIIKPIIDAITEINTADGNNDVTITAQFCDDFKNIREFLDARIEVRFSEKINEYFVERARDKEKKLK